MQKRTTTLSVLALLIALFVSAVGVRPAWAEGTEIQVTGSVQSIDAATFTFVLLKDDTTTLTVNVAADFDFSTLAVGDQVQVTGVLNTDGTFTASSVAPYVPEQEFTGQVTSIDEAGLSFVIQTAEGDSLTVDVPEGFDFTSISVGDQVTVKGTLNEDGSVAATSVTTGDSDEDTGEKGPGDGFYCQNPDAQHPMGARLAERFGVDYATLLGWYCQGYGWGQIMLALQTAKITGEDPAALLQQRHDGSGWGKIWKNLGLTKKQHEDTSPLDANGDGRPDRGHRSNPGNGNNTDGSDTGDLQPGNGNGNEHGGSSNNGNGNSGHGGGHGGGHH